MRFARDAVRHHCPVRTAWHASTVSSLVGSGDGMARCHPCRCSTLLLAPTRPSTAVTGVALWY